MKIVKDTQNYYVCGVEGYLWESEKYWDIFWECKKNGIDTIFRNTIIFLHTSENVYIKKSSVSPVTFQYKHFYIFSFLLVWFLSDTLG